MGYNYYNSNGKKSGYSSKGIFGTTNYYGSDGRKRGYSSQGLFGTTNYYGRDGRKKGYSSDGLFGGELLQLQQKGRLQHEDCWAMTY